MVTIWLCWSNDHHSSLGACLEILHTMLPCESLPTASRDLFAVVLHIAAANTLRSASRSVLLPTRTYKALGLCLWASSRKLWTLSSCDGLIFFSLSIFSFALFHSLFSFIHSLSACLSAVWSCMFMLMMFGSTFVIS